MLSFLAKKLGSVVGVSAPPAPEFQVPDTLPKLAAKSGAELMKQGGFDAVPGAPSPATQTPAEFLRTALNERQDVIPTTKALAQSLPEKERLQWAIDSCEKVKDQLPETEQRALIAAGDYFADPSPIKQELARRAAEQTEFKGPAGWAAKAASLSSLTPQRPPPPAVKEMLAKEAQAKVTPKAPDVVGQCVAGAVMLAATLSALKAKKDEKPAKPEAAAVPKVPEVPKPGIAAAVPVPPEKPKPGSRDAVKLAQAYKPFVEKGLALAAG